MEIKYTDLYEKIYARIPELNYGDYFYRNVWKDVKDKIAAKLLKDNYFISRDDVFFDESVLKTRNRIAIKRYGALGDLLQLVPIVHYLRKKYKFHLTLLTQKQYVWIFVQEKELFDNVIPMDKYSKYDYDKIIYLDGVLEQDHSLVSEERNMHRIKIYEKFLNLDLQEYDFSLSQVSKNNERINSLLNVTL